MTDELLSPVSLSDADLLSATRELVGRSRLLEADLVVHLGEIEERRLFLDAAYPSMFAFCMEELGFSEDAAYNRLAVARAGRRLPAVIEALRSGRVHLAGLRLLAPHLTELNHEIVLMQAAGKSKRMIEELVARLAPSPPVRNGIRRVPESVVASWSPISRQPLSPSELRLAGTSAASSPAAPAESDVPAGADLPLFTDGAAPEASVAAPSLASPEVGPPRAIVTPLSAETFRVQFTASRELRDKLLEAQGLLRHRVPNGDLAAIIEMGLDLLIEKVKKERFGIGRKPRPRPPPEEEVLPATVASRHIPDAIKRAVYERDEGCCAFVDERGRRCRSTDGITFEHDEGFARTRSHDIEHIRLYCRAHNQHAADKLYGRAFMERARKGSQPVMEPEPATEPEPVTGTEPAKASQPVPGRDKEAGAEPSSSRDNSG